MNQPWHRLTEIDPEKRRAICSVCGRTSLVWLGVGWQCFTVRQRYYSGLKAATAARQLNLDDGQITIDGLGPDTQYVDGTPKQLGALVVKLKAAAVRQHHDGERLNLDIYGPVARRILAEYMAEADKGDK